MQFATRSLARLGCLVLAFVVPLSSLTSLSGTTRGIVASRLTCSVTRGPAEPSRTDDDGVGQPITDALAGRRDGRRKDAHGV
ncbi:hypothetical protein [Natrialba asiatica]|uniref:hypothetical protein n=1 Tax=Natrialba asiatica TaxID=64602 RepID=UPI00067764F4|nr:hypothetical protein [Natrialba asiatica]